MDEIDSLKGSSRSNRKGRPPKRLTSGEQLDLSWNITLKQQDETSSSSPNENSELPQPKPKPTCEEVGLRQDDDSPRIIKESPRSSVPPPVIPFDNDGKAKVTLFEIAKFSIPCEFACDNFQDGIPSKGTHLFARFTKDGSRFSFIDAKGELVASGSLPYEPQVITSLVFLQAKEIIYIDAIPQFSKPPSHADSFFALQTMVLRVTFTTGAFSDPPKDPCDCTFRRVNQHVKTIMDALMFGLESNDANGTVTDDPSDAKGKRKVQELRSGSGSGSSDMIPTNSVALDDDDDDENGHQGNRIAFDAVGVYSSVRPTNTEPELDRSLIKDDFLTPLRPYQLRAANWMLARESIQSRASTSSGRNTFLHPLWQEYLGADGNIFYCNTFTGRLSLQPFKIHVGEYADSVTGGILADEPGLGKTLEVLACVLAHPRPKENPSAANNEPASEVGHFGTAHSAAENSDAGSHHRKKRRKTDIGVHDIVDVVQCVCRKDEDGHPGGLWVQCENCDIWQFAECVGYRQGDPTYSCATCTQEVATSPSELPTKGLIVTKGTLIVCPSAICDQWRDEIFKHIRNASLTVRVYQGVKAGDNISPSDLAQFDIVLTTYDVLGSDLYRVEPSRWQECLRNKKRYRMHYTPLTLLKWWRVCLDEAQMVESTTTKSAKMALYLRAEHRWCVSGTPIQRGMEDLYGLLLFLDAQPFSSRFWWLHAIQHPYEKGVQSARERLNSFLRPIMWRNTKADVIHELQLPTQIDKNVATLRFSAVEAHFYRKQHDACSEKVHSIMQKLRGLNASHHVISSLLHPLLRLRQACCHPQVGSGGVRSLHKNTMTMDELLEHLIVNSKVETQEAQRALLATFNGIAALDIINDNRDEAAGHYREALSMVEHNAPLIETDSLQQLHIFHNLAELVDSGLGARTLRDHTFREQAEQLRQKTIMEYGARVTGCTQQYQETNAKVEHAITKAKTTFSSARDDWWSTAIDILESRHMTAEFISRVKMELHTADMKRVTALSSISNRFDDAKGLQYVITTQIFELLGARHLLVASVANACHSPTRLEIEESSRCRECNRSRKRASTIVCSLCKIKGVMYDYSRKLFDSLRTGEKDIENAVEGDELEPTETEGDENWWQKKSDSSTSGTDSELNRIIKMLIAAVKSVERNHPLLQDAKEFMDLVSLMKKEFMAASKLWASRKDQINRLDELDMATTKIRLRFPGEVVEPGEELFKLYPHDVEPTSARLQADKGVQEAALQAAKNQLKYLKNLALGRQKNKIPSSSPEAELKRTQAATSPVGDDSLLSQPLPRQDTTLEHPGTMEEDDGNTCPICREPVGPDVVLLMCGHTFCYECMSFMIEGTKQLVSTIKCPTCRTRVNIDDISYVSETTGPSSCDFPIKGSWGTKLEAVLRGLFSIKPPAKSLVFSQWNDVLELVARALKENDVKFARVNGKKTFSGALRQFKSDPTVRILLLPVASGANGLNLIEATHVFLVEPLLNPAVEAQAINRVHRIGQLCETYVHRFIIQGTIEERVCDIARHKAQGKPDLWRMQKKKEMDILTLKDLMELFPETVENV